ncbi:hypothetical protein SRHO_G00310640 [Serrasalmus rhombeus]
MNTLGSYRCSCADGFSLQANRRSCKAKTDPGDRPPLLLTANLKSIWVTYLNGSSVPNLKPADTNGTQALDFLHRDETICWLQTSKTAGQLWCAKLTKLKGISEKRQIRIAQNLQREYPHLHICTAHDDLPYFTLLFSPSTLDVEHMALDWLTGNFYFVDRVNDRIFACGEKADACVTIVELDLQNPRGIALDPSAGKLFFSDYGTVAKLERCGLDGSERGRIVESRMEQPTALTLDLVRKLVYWADTYLDIIEVVDYDGKNRHTIIRGNLVSGITNTVQKIHHSEVWKHS